MNTNGNYYVNRLRRRESFKRLINIGLSAICLFLEIALFAYMWQFHFQFQLVDPLQKIWYRGFLLENGIYSVILIFFPVPMPFSSANSYPVNTKAAFCSFIKASSRSSFSGTHRSSASR